MNTITDLDKSVAVEASDVLTILQPPLRNEITTVNSITELRKLRPQWEALAAVADHAPFYLTYAYCETAAIRLFARRRRVIVVVQIFTHDDELVALWPMRIERRTLWHVATPLSCGNHEEYSRPLIKSDADQQYVTNAALAAALRIKANVLELWHVEDNSYLHRALQGKKLPRFFPNRVGRWGASSIDLRQFATINDYYQTVLSAGLRRNLKRQMKSLKSVGEIEIGWCESVEGMQSVLQWLFENKRRWAKARGIVTPWLETDYVRDFHLELAGKIDLAKTPLVAFIKCDGVPIAASISWVGNRVHEWCITTYDENYHSYGVGVLLLEFLVLWSHAHHLDFDFRFLIADYKDRWANQHTQQRRQTVFLNRFGRLHECQMFVTAGRESFMHWRRRSANSRFQAGMAKAT